MSHSVQAEASTLQVCVLYIQREQEQNPGGNQISITAVLPPLG